jgi:hypothetical protein
MSRAEKLISAKFFPPDEIRRLRITEEGIPLETTRRKSLNAWEWAGLTIAGLCLSIGAYLYLYEQGVVASPKLLLMQVTTAVGRCFLHG